MNDEPAPRADLVGTVLAGRYRIVKRLGEGAMGAVYLGEHLKIGRRDAIKVLRDSLATDREATLRFLRGARNVSAIRHPNVCTIYDFSDTADGLQFLAMEFVEGETLKDLLDRERRLPVARAVAIAIQTAEALDAAHDAGIVHRDLKPGNIMLVRGRDGRDVVKVVDFDIAKGPDAEGEEVTRLGFVVGTPEYMSPEQLMGETLNGPSDVYSLALVLFRMLTGALPFQAESTQDVMIQRLTHSPLRLTEALPEAQYPDGLQQTLDRALDRRAASRPDAAAFARELTSLLAGGAAAGFAGGLAHGTAAAGAPAPTATGVGPQAGPSSGGVPRSTVPGVAADTEVPRTRVGPAAGDAKSAAAGAGGQRRRNIAIAVAVTTVAIVGASAMLMRGGGTAASGNETASTGGENPGIPPVPFESTTVALDGDTGTIDGPPAVPPAAGDGGTDGPRDDPPPPAGIAIDPERASGLLFRQLDRFPPVASSPPTAATLVAIADTARAVWDLRQIAAADRALAAYVLGEAHNARGQWRVCVQWLDSALALAPGNSSYATMRSNCREQIR